LDPKPYTSPDERRRRVWCSPHDIDMTEWDGGRGSGMGVRWGTEDGEDGGDEEGKEGPRANTAVPWF
jgi:hypothetical protein